jgi:hypothetical protein
MSTIGDLGSFLRREEESSDQVLSDLLVRHPTADESPSGSSGGRALVTG